MNKERFKRLYSKILKKDDSCYGIATALEDYKDIPKGETGIITAYLPEMKKFAIDFCNHIWICLDITEEEFLKNFEVEMFEE